MFNSSSPLYIKPRLSMDLIKWGLAFNRSCNPKHVDRAIPVIKDISVLSQELYDQIKLDEGFNFHYDKKGLFMVCRTEKGLEEEVKVAKLAHEQGLEVTILNKNEFMRCGMIVAFVKCPAYGIDISLWFKC